MAGGAAVSDMVSLASYIWALCRVPLLSGCRESDTCYRPMTFLSLRMQARGTQFLTMFLLLPEQVLSLQKRR